MPAYGDHSPNAGCLVLMTTSGGSSVYKALPLPEASVTHPCWVWWFVSGFRLGTSGGDVVIISRWSLCAGAGALAPSVFVDVYVAFFADGAFGEFLWLVSVLCGVQ